MLGYDLQGLKRLVALGCLLLLAATAGSGCAGLGPRAFDAGPFYSARPDFEGHEGFTALGPLVAHRQAADGRTFAAVRPLWSRARDPNQDRAVTDIVWPAGMFKTRQGELDWRFLFAFGHDFDVAGAPSRHRWSVFPLFFGGKDADDQGYFAFFPLGGTLRELLGRDRAWFVLFPLYASSWQGDNHTTSVLWPIYSHTRGGDLFRLRVWPVYGYAHHPERWTKRFVMWPIWTSVAYHYSGEENGGGFILFPLYGQVVLPGRQSRMLLLPFFRVEWGETDHFAFNAPWPILQYVKSPDQNKLYVFPVAGRRRFGHDQTWFVLWPVISGRRTERPHEVLTRFRILPFWYYENLESRPAQLEFAEEGIGADTRSESLSRYVRLWPLGMYRREETNRITRIPALWPLRHTPGIERNWAPLWTLYRRKSSATQSLTELLWGLVRVQREGASSSFNVFPLVQTQRAPDQMAWRFLYGLVGYQRDELQNSYQLLYFLRIRGRRRASLALEEEVKP